MITSALWFQVLFSQFSNNRKFKQKQREKKPNLLCQMAVIIFNNNNKRVNLHRSMILINTTRKFRTSDHHTQNSAHYSNCLVSHYLSENQFLGHDHKQIHHQQSPITQPP